MAVLRGLGEKRILALIVCFIIIGWGLYRVVLVPISMELDSVSAKIFAINQKISALPARIDDLQRMRDDYAKSVSVLESINSRVTLETSLPYFVKELEEVSKQAGTRISSISLGNLVAGYVYSRIPVTITFQGSYRQVERFIQGLGELERAFGMNDLRLESPGFSKTEDINEEHLLDAALSLMVYVVPEGGDS